MGVIMPTGRRGLAHLGFRCQFFPMPEPRRTSRLTPLLLLAILAALLWREWPRELRLNEKASPRVVTPRGELGADERSTIDLFEQSRSSVVHITTTTQQRYRTLWGTGAKEVEGGSGSGFLWDDRGFVVTNYHVVRGAKNVFVRLSDGDYVQAFLVGSNPDHDLAVLRIDAGGRELHPVILGRSGDLRVGQDVFAIGNPFGLDWTLTTGVISGLDRSILSVTRTPIEGVIQTDAAINPGNSGGPLLDSAGRLIGVNTAIYSPSGASAGIGFAVPVDTVNELVPQLIEFGRQPRPGLGVMLLSDSRARAAGIDGLVVTQVVPGGAGERAGIRDLVETQRGVQQVDVILEVDGQRTRLRRDLDDALAGKKVGDRVEVVVERDRRRQETLTVELQDVGGA